MRTMNAVFIHIYYLGKAYAKNVLHKLETKKYCITCFAFCTNNML